MDNNHWGFPTNRREFLTGIGGGFAGLALTSMLADEGLAMPASGAGQGSLRIQHHPPKVKRVIQLFMNGGASPMDLYDYKPALIKYHGQKLPAHIRPEGSPNEPGLCLKSPFTFKQYGQSGRWVSDQFPEQAKLVDEMAFFMAMASKSNVHGPASYMMNTGFILPGFPCMGAWISYAIGSLRDNLPTFVVLPDARGLPYNQRGNFSSGFLPVVHQGTMINGTGPGAVSDLFAGDKYKFANRETDKAGLDALTKLNKAHAAQHQGDSRLDARIASYELAARMQLSAPEAFDISRESQAVKDSYGIGTPHTDDFGKRCLLAARLAERGVRFTQVWSGPQGAVNNWDNHGNIRTELPPMAASIDKPIAALLRDLKARGLDKDTLVIWSTEFGRTPFAQGGEGRDHNGGTFVSWIWGAGVKPGVAYGQSDELAFKTAENTTYSYDFHATILHLLGIDHTKLTWRQNGVDRRLTDVHGHVVKEVLA